MDKLSKCSTIVPKRAEIKYKSENWMNDKIRINIKYLMNDVRPKSEYHR